MKLRFVLLGLIALFGFSLFLASAEEHSTGSLRHVVAFKFKDSATAAQVEDVKRAFADLQTKIAEIGSFEQGENISPEGLNKGFTHCFILTFSSEADRDIYLEHPDHKAFGQMLGPVLEDVFVIDFWAN